MSFICEVITETGVCGYDGAKSPASLGRHKWFKHGIKGTAHMTAKEKRELAPHQPEQSTRIKCFYCPMTFDKVRGRSRHITEIHPGMSKTGPSELVLPVNALDSIIDLNQKKGRKAHGHSRPQTQTLTFTKEEFAFQQAVANAAGYLQAKADELAGRDGYVQTDFARQCFEILHRQTLR